MQSNRHERDGAEVQRQRMQATGDGTVAGTDEPVAVQPAHTESIELTQREAMLLDAGRRFGMAHAYAEAAKQFDKAATVLRREGQTCQRDGERMLAEALKPADTLKHRVSKVFAVLAGKPT